MVMHTTNLDRVCAWSGVSASSDVGQETLAGWTLRPVVLNLREQFKCVCAEAASSRTPRTTSAGPPQVVFSPKHLVSPPDPSTPPGISSVPRR
jgi:hypothetical protein